MARKSELKTLSLALTTAIILSSTPATVQASSYISTQLNTDYQVWGFIGFGGIIKASTLAPQIKGIDKLVAFIKSNKKLPAEYITKREARTLGWLANKTPLSQVAPGKIIGGDRFHNFDGKLDTSIKWIELYVTRENCGVRLVVSEDFKKIFITTDHYKSFHQVVY